ncbi:MAG: response regulator [Calditrichaceae bacterium]|nr:response regulator [Calditrichaceae bacterium]MBN2708667.1 response regulator [Calditrichaceae bacterium]RQV96754.1 MAG: response regulator [Calditrichota bacterium]
MAYTIKKALVVDDEEPLREIIGEVLALLNIETFKAENGNTALEIAQKHKAEIDLMLIDFYMPEMSGEEAYAKLKHILPNCPVVFMSGYDYTDQISSTPGDPPKVFVKKPFTIAQLQTTVKSFIENV